MYSLTIQFHVSKVNEKKIQLSKIKEFPFFNIFFTITLSVVGELEESSGFNIIRALARNSRVKYKNSEEKPLNVGTEVLWLF